MVSLFSAHVYEVASTPSFWGNWLNGVGQFNTPTNSVASPSGAYIGTSNGPTYYNGDWAELIIFGRRLTTAERALVINYLNGRYGLGAV